MHICFPDADRTEMETPTQDETTLLANQEEAFVLEPVAITRIQLSKSVPSTHKCTKFYAKNIELVLLYPPLLLL